MIYDFYTHLHQLKGSLYNLLCQWLGLQISTAMYQFYFKFDIFYNIKKMNKTYNDLMCCLLVITHKSLLFNFCLCVKFFYKQSSTSSYFSMTCSFVELNHGQLSTPYLKSSVVLKFCTESQSPHFRYRQQQRLLRGPHVPRRQRLLRPI